MHAQRRHGLPGSHRLDGDDGFAVNGLRLEMPRHPLEVIIELDPARMESSAVDEFQQATALVQIIHEGEVTGRIAQRDKILEKRYLHVAAWKQLAAMPGEVR